MKIFVVLPASIVFVSILFCPMVRAAPSIPDDIEIVNPDPSLPKELSAFFGKYEGVGGIFKYFLIVSKINKEKVIFHIWRETSMSYAIYNGWETITADVFKERGEYQLWYKSRVLMETSAELVLKGEYLHIVTGKGSVRLRRVP